MTNDTAVGKISNFQQPPCAIIVADGCGILAKEKAFGIWLRLHQLQTPRPL